MGNAHTKVALILIVLLGIFLMRTQKTAADIFDEETITGNKLTTTTLEISVRNSASFSKETFFFQISGMKKDGFDIRGLRIKKDGKMNFNYRLKTDIKNESGTLCHNLNLSMYNTSLQKITDGKLSGFLIDRDMSSSGIDDWIFLIELDSDQPSGTSQCNFDIVITTWRTSADEQGGFYDKKILQNTITAH